MRPSPAPSVEPWWVGPLLPNPTKTSPLEVPGESLVASSIGHVPPRQAAFPAAETAWALLSSRLPAAPPLLLSCFSLQSGNPTFSDSAGNSIHKLMALKLVSPA